MKNENLLHVGYEYQEALQSKKDLLDLEIHLLETAKSIKNYHTLRSEELKLRLRLYLRAKESLVKLRKLQKSLPEFEKQDKPEKKEVPKKQNKVEQAIQKQIEKSRESDIDLQLKEIREKLESLRTK